MKKTGSVVKLRLARQKASEIPETKRSQGKLYIVVRDLSLVCRDVELLVHLPIVSLGLHQLENFTFIWAREHYFCFHYFFGTFLSQERGDIIKIKFFNF